MNLEQAIRAGAARVDRRVVGHYVQVRTDGKVGACLLGAAYLGCNPDVDPAEVNGFEGRMAINTWLREAKLYWTGVAQINDMVLDSEWDRAIEAVRQERPHVLAQEVCDDVEVAA
jgi:hypothetical protein